MIVLRILLYILLGIVLLLALIFSLRIKVYIRLEDELRVRAGLGPVVLTVVPSSSTGSNMATGLMRPVLLALHSISLRVVSAVSSAHLKAMECLGDFAVLPREAP